MFTTWIFRQRAELRLGTLWWEHHRRRWTIELERAAWRYAERTLPPQVHRGAGDPVGTSCPNREQQTRNTRRAEIDAQYLDRLPRRVCRIVVAPSAPQFQLTDFYLCARIYTLA